MLRIKSKLTGKEYQFPDGFDTQVAGELIKEQERRFTSQDMITQRLNPTPSASPTTPTLRDRFGTTVREGLESVGFSRSGARGASEGFQNISDFIPLTAASYAGDSFGREMAEDDYFGAAGSLAEGALEVNPVTKAVGDAAMFIGAKSKLFNQEAADLANDMKAQGATRAEIWEATGNQYGTPMIHGYDGQLRQEITDEGAELSTDTQGLIDLVAQEGGEIPVSKAMYHDDFFQAYDPDSIANRASFQAVTDEDFLGSYTPSKNLLEARMSKGGELTPEDQLSSTMLHEIQHLAQRVEGFGTGGNDDIMALLPQAIDKRRNSLVEQINKLPDIEVNQKASALSQLAEAVDKKFPSTPSGQGMYHNNLKAIVLQLHGNGLISSNDHDEMMAMLDSDVFMDQRNGFNLRQRFNEYLKSKIPEIEQSVGFSLPTGESINKYRSIQSKIVDSLGPDEKYAYNRKSELKNELYQLNEALQTINNRYDSGSNTYKMYLDIFGEQEARLTQDRQSMSMLDRIGQPPEYNDLGINISKDGEVRLVSGATKPSMDNSVVLGDLSEFIKSNNRGLLDEIDTSYRGSHTAPYRDDEGYNPSLDDVSSMYGDDIYTSNALRYFGEGRDYDKKAIDIIQKMAGNPDAEITIYRALPKGKNEINPRDWVTTTKEYALEHIGDDEGYHIVSKKVKASDVFTEGNSIHEFGYDPLEK